MFGEHKNRHSFGENGSSTEFYNKTASPKGNSNPNSEHMRHFGNADSHIPVENSNSTVDGSGGNLLRKQSKGRKRGYKLMSKPEPIGCMTKKIRVRKRDLAAMNRRTSIRLKGQATPLYFPPLRFRDKRSHQVKENGEIAVLDGFVEKKKRGRPKREKVETHKFDEQDTSKSEDFEAKKSPRMKRTFTKVVTRGNNEDIQTETTQNESDISIEKSETSLPKNDKETPTDLAKPKRRIWNIPRNKLPSFTIVNNPLLKPSSDGKDIKSLAGLRHSQTFVSSGIPIYACRICGKHFARKLSVRGHMKSHSKLFEHKHKHKQVKKSTIIVDSPPTNSYTPKEQIIPPPTLQKSISKTNYVCDICGRIFNHKMGIRGHKKSHSSLMMARRRELLLNAAKARNDFSEQGQLNSLSLVKPLNTRSRAGNFDDILFSEETEQTEYPAWKKEVRIGEDHQVANLPSPGCRINVGLLAMESTVEPELREDLIWSTEFTVPQVDEYLKLSDSPLSKFGGRNQEYALHILFRCQGNIWDALTILIEGKSIIAEDDPVYLYNFTGLAFWTMEERNEFKTAWIKYGKDFSLIQKHIASKSFNQVIEFYYRWTIECPEEYRKYSRTISSRKYLQTVSSPSNDSNSVDTPNTEDSDKNFEKVDDIPVENTDSVEAEYEEVVVVNPVKKSRLIQPPSKSTPTRPPKSLKELVSSYQDRKEIKTQPGSRRNKDALSKKRVTLTKEKKHRFPHRRAWSKQLHTTRRAKQMSKRIVQKEDEYSRTKYPSKATMLEGIPVLKPVPNSTHKRIINRIGSFPCKKCRRVFNRIKSLNAHMKCHSIRAGKSHTSTAPVQDVTQIINSD